MTKAILNLLFFITLQVFSQKDEKKIVAPSNLSYQQKASNSRDSLALPKSEAKIEEGFLEKSKSVQFKFAPYPFADLFNEQFNSISVVGNDYKTLAPGLFYSVGIKSEKDPTDNPTFPSKPARIWLEANLRYFVKKNVFIEASILKSLIKPPPGMNFGTTNGQPLTKRLGMGLIF